MTIQERAEKAVEYKHAGCNCCQAVTAACSDLVDADPQTLLQLGAGFGGGMGCMEATCGALDGAVIVAGLLTGGQRTVLASRQMLASFREKSGATVCKDLKGRGTGVVLCPCDDCVRHAVYALGEAFNLE